jgi:hypothetical protein
MNNEQLTINNGCSSNLRKMSEAIDRYSILE